ncbi:MAG: ribonuclease H-like domain-containing protein [Bacteroidota bacterium]
MRILKDINSEKILFLDIETVPQHPDYHHLSEKFKKLWDAKAKYIIKSRKDESPEKETPADVYNRAGIYSEFGKVIAVTVGMINGKNFRLKSFYGDEEKTLLEELISLLEKHYDISTHYLCAHNGKEFDFPFLARRIMMNQLPIPKILDNAGKKPWEVKHLLDTMELWAFGDYKNFTSLDLLATIFNIPSPKDDIDGSMVWKVYWKDKDIERIVKYNRKDVLTVAQIFLRFKGEPLIEEKNVVIIE